ncbi:SpoIIAA family protein [Tateyamaria pelophila]|uniref:STAS/SEC14 domain-containing protein n=1 Tax=Tateyamaria pelophila TaxID=328415 RepID=UPI001CBAA284|nr:STAS/SEC14 domain-containing protein [Tateyamaria pelophila]
MLKVDIRERDNIAIVTPEGRISTDQIDAFSRQVNDYINEADQVPNLVILTKSVPYWADFNALKEHLRFVRGHHNLVRKVAIVSDSKLLWLAKSIVDHFVSAKVRRFNEDAVDDAIAWAQTEDDHPGAIVEIEGMPSDVVAVDLRGLITSQDYTSTLIPLVTERAQKHDKLKMLCVLGDYFDGYSPNAMWDDMRFGFSHLTTFSKLALVTDQEWIRNSAKIFGMLMPTEVMVFDLAELEDAKHWIGE